MSELKQFYRFAQQTAYEAGVLTLGYFARKLEIIRKGDGSPVTEADRNAEAMIRREIESAFPDHGIHGEEHGIKDPKNGCSYTWFIDPIDGTKSFIHGVPLYTTLLALLRDDRSVVGVIQLPALDQQLSAAEGMGTVLNGRRVEASKTSDLSESVVLYTDYNSLQEDGIHEGWKPLVEGARFTRSWGDAYGHLLVATGRAEIMIDPIVEPYDVACLPVILREAGGEFTTWSGKESVFGGNGVSFSQAMHPLVEKHLFQS